MPRLAIAGLGAAARTIHLPAWRLLPQVEWAGAFDPLVTMAPGSMPVYPTLADLMKKARPDVLVIAAPTRHHHALAMAALREGVHVLCEKPFASTMDEAIEMVRFAREQKLKLSVNNEYRFMACHQAGKAAIGTPAFGDLLFVHMSQTFGTRMLGADHWRNVGAEHTCLEFGTHVFDLCRYFFGVEPLRLQAIMPRPVKNNDPDLLNLIDVEFPGQRFARITLDRLSRGRHRYLDIRLDGTEASIETEIGGKLSFAAGINPVTRRPFVDFDLVPSARALLYQGEVRQTLARDSRQLFAAATAKLLAQLLTAITEDVEPACSGADNLRSFGMMRAAYDSAATGKGVELGYLQGLI